MSFKNATEGSQQRENVKRPSRCTVDCRDVLIYSGWKYAGQKVGAEECVSSGICMGAFAMSQREDRLLPACFSQDRKLNVYGRGSFVTLERSICAQPVFYRTRRDIISPAAISEHAQFGWSDSPIGNQWIGRNWQNPTGGGVRVPASSGIRRHLLGACGLQRGSDFQLFRDRPSDSAARMSGTGSENHHCSSLALVASAYPLAIDL